MNKLEIDYSEIPRNDAAPLQEDWEPPIHKFFGKKDARGKMEKEPVYYHQEYPRLMYAKREDRIVAREVKSDEERAALGDGWETTPAVFGYIGAPSFEEALKLRDERAADQAEEQANAIDLSAALHLAAAGGGTVPANLPRRGRPAKVE